ncbi:hypothetical protein BSK50_30600, partial [Paenibacillus odorifer]
MSVVRRDSWTITEDEILATTTLTYIKNGKTQLQAFEDVGLKLNRTQAACGFRWNGAVRKQYDKELTEAKRLRLEARDQVEARVKIKLKSVITFDNIINSLISIKH